MVPINDLLMFAAAVGVTAVFVAIPCFIGFVLAALAVHLLSEQRKVAWQSVAGRQLVLRVMCVAR